MLAPIDLHDQALRVTNKIDNVSPYLNLTAEMRAWRGKSVAEMPP
jgi:hypothetical protein